MFISAVPTLSDPEPEPEPGHLMRCHIPIDELGRMQGVIDAREGS